MNIAEICKIPMSQYPECENLFKTLYQVAFTNSKMGAWNWENFKQKALKEKDGDLFLQTLANFRFENVT